MSAKLSLVLSTIDTSRCMSQWDAIDKLGRKYSKELNKDQSNFEQILTAESSLEKFLSHVKLDPVNHWKNDGRVYIDNPDVTKIHFEDYSLNYQHEGKKMWIAFSVAPTGNTELNKVESSLLKLSNQSLTQDESWQLDTILAKVYYFSEKFDLCEQILDKIPNKFQKSALGPNYSLRLFISSFAIKGMILERKGLFVQALDLYDTAISIYKKELGPMALLVVSNNVSGRDEEIVNWPEEILYRRGLVSLSILKEGGISRCLEYLQNLEFSNPPTFRLYRRAMMTRSVIKISSELFKNGTFEKYQESSGVEKSKRKSFRSYITDLHFKLIELIKLSHGFPFANEQNMDAVQESEQSAADWKVSRANSLSDLVQLLRIQYECAKLTFNSPTVMRNIINTLIRFGDYHEAYLASRTYADYIRRLLDSRRKDFAAMLDRVGADKKYLLEECNRIMYCQENESIVNMVETLTSSMDLMIFMLKKSKEAIGLYSLISEIRDAEPNTICVGSIAENTDLYLFARAEIMNGVIHGIHSRSDISSKKRCISHNASINSFASAVEMCDRSLLIFKSQPAILDKVTRTAAEAHFYLGFQSAIGGRNVPEAIVHVKKSLNLNPKSVRSWHLLALLVSSASPRANNSGSGAQFEEATSRNSRLSSALKVCEIGLRQNEWWWRAEQEILGNLEGESKANSGSTSGFSNTMSSLAPMAPIEPDDASTAGVSAEEGMEYIKLRLLHFLLQRELEGPESSLNYMPLLFQLYSRICGPIQALPTDLHDASKSLLILNEQALTLEKSKRDPKYAGGGGSDKNYQMSNKNNSAGAMSVLSASRMSNLNNLSGLMQPKMLAKSLGRSVLSVRAPVMKWKQVQNSGDSKFIKDKTQADELATFDDENEDDQHQIDADLNNPADKMSRKKRFAGKLKSSVKKSFGSKGLGSSANDDIHGASNSTGNEHTSSKINNKSKLNEASGVVSSDRDSAGSLSSDNSIDLSVSEDSSDSDLESTNHFVDPDSTKKFDTSVTQNPKKSKHKIKIGMSKPKAMINNAINDVKNKASKHDKHSKNSLGNPDVGDISQIDPHSKKGGRLINSLDIKRGNSYQSSIENLDHDSKLDPADGSKPMSFSANYFNTKSNTSQENSQSIVKSDDFTLDSSAVALASQSHKLSLNIQKEYKINGTSRPSPGPQAQAGLTRNSLDFSDKRSTMTPTNNGMGAANSNGIKSSSNLKHHTNALGNSYSQETVVSSSPYSTVYFKPTVTRSRRCHELSNQILSQLWMFSSECFLLLGRYDDGLASLSDAAKANPLEPKVMLIRSQIFMAQALSHEKSFSLDDGFEFDMYKEPPFFSSTNPSVSKSDALSDLQQDDCFLEFYEPELLDSDDLTNSTNVLKNSTLANKDSLGSYKNEMIKIAESELRAAASLSPHDLDVMISLTKLEFKLGNWEMAYGLASEITQGTGWSNPEAWLILGLLEKKVAIGLGDPPVLPPFLGGQYNGVNRKKVASNIKIPELLIASDSISGPSMPETTFNPENISPNPETHNPESWLNDSLNSALLELSDTSETMKKISGEEASKYTRTLNSQTNYINGSLATDDYSFNSVNPTVEIDKLSDSFNLLQTNSSPSIERAHTLSQMPNKLNGSQISNQQLVSFSTPRDSSFINDNSGGKYQSNDLSVQALPFNQGFFNHHSTKVHDPSQMNVVTSWQRVRHFLSFALELEESQPIEPYESVLMF
ncbi:hypothetical protein AYI68_g5214 [Smittium mucronatum]|uniref:Uncharacterized protein n=1 Tax=Smittium mucronatum TaxID=133383 RepID=A0A1R0GUX8_9FUNG|nr:hypothetical protein AYI68_g5214 [Smittium mucronatum]